MENTQYRNNQLSNLWVIDENNTVDIKLVSREGETKWLRLTTKEHEAIKKILLSISL